MAKFTSIIGVLLFLGVLLVGCSNSTDPVPSKTDPAPLRKESSSLTVGKVSGETAAITYDRDKLISRLSAIFKRLNREVGNITDVQIERAYANEGEALEDWVLIGRGTNEAGFSALVVLPLTKQANGRLGVELSAAANTCTGVKCKLCKFYAQTGCECQNPAVPGQHGYCNHSTGPVEE